MANNPGSRHEEKRKYKRARSSFIVTYQLPAPLRVMLKTGGQNHTAVALDISGGGMGVVVNEEILKNAAVQLSFTLVNEQPGADREMRRWFELTGKALYCELVPKAGYRAGIVFEKIPDEDREFILEFVESLELKKQKL